jgi:putative tryptophan/tyrosine transport system substrate-binding protein
MIKRRQFIIGLGGAAAWPLAAHAQQRPAVGYVHAGTPSEAIQRLKDFHDGLKQTGFVEGGNLTIEYRWANGDNARLPELVADLVRRKVAVIVTSGLPGGAAKAATGTIPIVFLTGVNPVSFGLVASLSRPGGNLTGVSQLDDEVAPKRLEMMHALLPTATDFALLVDPSNPNSESQSNDMRAAARSLGLNVHTLQASGAGDFATVFESAVRLRAAGLVIGPNTFSSSDAANQELALLEARYALPTISFRQQFTSGFMPDASSRERNRPNCRSCRRTSSNSSSTSRPPRRSA